MVAKAEPDQPLEGTGGFINGADPLESPVGLFLLQVVVIMTTTRVLACGLGYLKQPRVIAEILAGIILGTCVGSSVKRYLLATHTFPDTITYTGPSVFGHIPGWLDHVFPKRSLPYLSLVANVGLVLYM